MVVIAPERSIEQRRSALIRANEIRTYRARVKRDLKRGRVSVTVLLEDVPRDLESMKVFDLLIATPKIGRTKAARILRSQNVSPSKTLAGLTERQRRALVVALIAYRPSVHVVTDRAA